MSIAKEGIHARPILEGRELEIYYAGWNEALAMYPKGGGHPLPYPTEYVEVNHGN